MTEHRPLLGDCTKNVRLLLSGRSAFPLPLTVVLTLSFLPHWPSSQPGNHNHKTKVFSS